MKRVHIGGLPASEGTPRDMALPQGGARLAPMETWSPLMSLRGEMDRLFDTFFASVMPAARAAQAARAITGIDPLRRWGWGGPLAALGEVMPQIDVVEAEGAFKIAAELPGMCEKDVEVTYSEGVLTIKGEKCEAHEEKGEGYHLSERNFGSFRRSFRIPDDVETGKIEATIGDGVLHITLPKTEAKEEEAPVTKIEIRKAA